MPCTTVPTQREKKRVFRSSDKGELRRIQRGLKREIKKCKDS